MEWLNALVPKSTKSQALAGEPMVPGKRTLVEQLSFEGEPIHPKIKHARECLLELGVKPERLGDLSQIKLATVDRDLELLAWIKVGGGRRGAKNRIIMAWNAGQDGLGNAEKWPTILHYVNWLDRAAKKSMGGLGYDEALGEMPTVRLAGAGVGGKLPVHPRAIYFCAAAQVGMDVRAGIEQGEGHYIPVGGFKNLLKDLKATLKAVGKGKEFPGALAVVNSVRGDLMRMIDVLAAQEAGVPFGVYRPDEHLEPDLQRKLIPLRDEIAEVGTPQTDLEATSVAAQLAGVLAVAIPDMREVKRNHGSGSVDPHGPGHAIGLAIDMFYGAGDGKYGHQNKAIKDEAWPFIHLLIAEKGPLVGLSPTLRPKSLGQMAATSARKVAELMHDHAPDFLVEVQARERTPEQAADDRSTHRKFTRLRWKAFKALSERERSLGAARKKLPKGHPLRAELVTEKHRLRAIGIELRHQDPRTVPLTLQTCLARLAGLELRVDLAIDKATPDLDGIDWRGGFPTGKLLSVIGDLQGIADEAQAAEDAIREGAAVKSANEPYTRKLVERCAQDDRLLFDQPSVMVEALNEVTSGGSVLQANHHWVVAPMAILGDPKLYGEALKSDMALRQQQQPPQLERVLGVMAESQGGRDILTAPRPHQRGIAEFHLALSEITTDADAMIARVAKKVISPYEDGGKLAELRDRGFYLAEDEGEGSLESD